MINYTTLTLGTMTGISLIYICTYYSTKYQLGKIYHYMEIRNDFAALSKDVNNLDQLHNFPTLQLLLEGTHILKNRDPRNYENMTFQKKRFKKTNADTKATDSFFHILHHELDEAPEEIQDAVYQLYDIIDHIFATNAPLKHKLHQFTANSNRKKNLYAQNLTHSPEGTRNTTVTDIAYLTNFPPFAQAIPKHS